MSDSRMMFLATKQVKRNKLKLVYPIKHFNEIAVFIFVHI